jgi:murein L,D-transpeptidase YafK
LNIQYSTLFLLAFKKEQQLEVWAQNQNGDPVFIRSYSFTATTGTCGPKLKEGDRQIPEGIYSVEYLNPNSKFHLSFKLNYPNAFDQAMAEREGRTNLGGDIFIHGGAQTTGCIAIGDEAIEELYALVENTGKENVTVIISPYDARNEAEIKPETAGPAWLEQLYTQIYDSLLPFRKK